MHHRKRKEAFRRENCRIQNISAVSKSLTNVCIAELVTPSPIMRATKYNSFSVFLHFRMVTASVKSFAVEQEDFLDHLFSTVYSAYSLLGIFLNLTLLWLIVTHKHDCIREYRILLGNSTCTLLLLSLLTFFLQLR